ncbi:PBSX family phage terminase large subunit [Jeotgalibacillus soli]|nr:PBSX family phage terminase large subunit [Jeotgalibacillus soli]
MNKVRMSEIISPHFLKFWKASRKKKHLRYVLKGGRGSGKSFHIPLRIVNDIMEYPVSAICMRKVQNTIKKSVFEQIKAATIVMGVSHLFKFVPSNLEITYLPRGNKIYFAGADDPEKLKSIKDAEYPVSILWIEELAEFKTEDEVTTIENSVLREELVGKITSESARKKAYTFDYSFYYSYNPPKRKQSWLNKKYESVFIDANTFVDHSTYLDNPHLSKRFIEEAENVKAKKPRKYDWEYMGKAIGSGVVPFDNLTFRKITNDELRSFDNIVQGIDWGYGPDPYCFLRLHYDKTRRRLFLLDEHYGQKISNREAAEWIVKKGYQTIMIIADSAEPKSISEMKTYGVRIKGAVKGPGSVEFGEKWLDDLEEIVIDYERTPFAAKEFEDIDYQTDSNGDQKARLEDKDNHAIDTTRYATEPLRKKGMSVLT